MCSMELHKIHVWSIRIAYPLILIVVGYGVVVAVWGLRRKGSYIASNALCVTRIPLSQNLMRRLRPRILAP